MSRWIKAVMVLLASTVAGCIQTSHHSHPPPVILDSGPRQPDAGPVRHDAGHDAGSCSETPCRLVAPQCGCGAGEACYVSSGVRTCMSAGTASEGAACLSTNDCQAGLICLTIANTVVARCARFCDGDADCTSGPGSLCAEGIDTSGNPVDGVTTCSPSCDPVTGGGCPGYSKCSLSQEATGAMRVFTGCVSSAGHGVGETCTTAEDCDLGLFCGDYGSSQRCVQFCRYPDSSPCISSACQRFATPLVVAGVEYGGCF